MPNDVDVTPITAGAARELLGVCRETFDKLRDAGALDGALVRIKGMVRPRYNRAAILQLCTPAKR